MQQGFKEEYFDLLPFQIDCDKGVTAVSFFVMKTMNVFEVAVGRTT